MAEGCLIVELLNGGGVDKQGGGYAGRGGC